MKLKVGRRVAGSVFTIVGDSPVHAPQANQLNTFTDVRIPVAAGDIIGTHTRHDGLAQCANPGNPGFAFNLTTGDPPPGTTRDFGGLTGSVKYDISATVEPDCDNDGFGDETQDDNLNSCPPGPSATITKAPKNKVKTRKNRATATFTFTASEADAAFNCALDGKEQFEPCVSPLTVTVRRGEHIFSVTATDAGGNAGAAATDEFKVKRKRKRKK